MLFGGAAACAALSGCALLGDTRDARLPEIAAGGKPLMLIPAAHDLPFARGAWLYDGRAFPVLRLKQGEALDVTLRNALAEHTSIHWHGVRGPNAMDGVPYLTQAPVQPGADFAYRFTPPDPGTFFFHPHCNTAEQMGRGLLGALIVDDGALFDDDVVMILKDWRVADDGTFLPFYTASGASKAGTFGALRTVNGVPDPVLVTRPKSAVRLRLINADPTRIAEIGLDGAPAEVIAVDGNPVERFALDTWRLGPGMRLDLVAYTGQWWKKIQLIDYFAADPVVLATLELRGAQNPGVIVTNTPRAGDDFSGARRLTLALGAGVEADALAAASPIVLPDGRRIDLADSLCLAQGTFWTLDGKSWPDRDHRHLPPPLYAFRRGERVVLEIENTTSRAHPIHIHGHTMTVLSASLLNRPVHRADTVLVLPNERVTVGFVADNPGNWMIHCHIIEHQESGMMGWFRVS